MRRQLLLDAVEALEVRGTSCIRVAHEPCDFRDGPSCALRHAPHPRLDGRRHEHAEESLAARERNGRGVRDDDDLPALRRVADGLDDERTHVVALGRSHHVGIPEQAPVGGGEMRHGEIGDEAIEQMELLGHDFFVFTDAASNQVSVVYRRRDGNYGLIEQEAA